MTLFNNFDDELLFQTFLDSDITLSKSISQQFYKKSEKLSTDEDNNYKLEKWINIKDLDQLEIYDNDSSYSAESCETPS